MAQIALYRLNIIPGPNRGHSVAVPEIVEAGIRAANGRGGLFECPVDGWLCQMVPQLIREHKLVLLPQYPGNEPLLSLFHFPPLQMFHHEGGNGDGAGLTVFRSDKLIGFHTLFLVKLHLLVDG